MELTKKMLCKDCACYIFTVTKYHDYCQRGKQKSQSFWMSLEFWI